MRFLDRYSALSHDNFSSYFFAGYQGMEISSGSSVISKKYPMLPPRSPFQVIVSPHSDFISSSITNSKTSTKVVGEVLHYRASSDGYLLEQPSWLDDLLDEPDSPLCIAHHRSSSDSDALLGSPLTFETGFECLLPLSGDTTVDQICKSSFPQKSGRNVPPKAMKNQESSNVSDSSIAATASKTDSRRSKQYVSCFFTPTSQIYL